MPNALWAQHLRSRFLNQLLPSTFHTVRAFPTPPQFRIPTPDNSLGCTPRRDARCLRPSQQGFSRKGRTAAPPKRIYSRIAPLREGGSLAPRRKPFAREHPAQQPAPQPRSQNAPKSSMPAPCGWICTRRARRTGRPAPEGYHTRRRGERARRTHSSTAAERALR